MRPTTSVAPPAAYGTMNVMVFSGNAAAGPDTPKTQSTAAAKIRPSFIFVAPEESLSSARRLREQVVVPCEDRRHAAGVHEHHDIIRAEPPLADMRDHRGGA